MVDTRYRSIYSSITAGSFSPPGEANKPVPLQMTTKIIPRQKHQTKTVSFVGLYPPRTMGIFLHPL